MKCKGDVVLNEAGAERLRPVPLLGILVDRTDERAVAGGTRADEELLRQALSAADGHLHAFELLVQ